MSRNVRCTGQQPDPDDAGQTILTGCDWKGERYTFHAQTIGPSWLEKPNPDYAKALTRKPCPRCGGDVAVIA